MFGKNKKAPKEPEEKLPDKEKELDQDALEQVSAGGNPFPTKRIKVHELDEDVYNKA